MQIALANKKNNASGYNIRVNPQLKIIEFANAKFQKLKRSKKEF